MKQLLLLFFLGVGITAACQTTGWQNRAADDGGVFGAGIEKARAAAAGMKPAKKPVTVALIGYGIDINHPAIKEAIWVNPKEKQNGKDDDKNGWVDDLHGWNFLGNDTMTLDRISREGDREYLRLKDKYQHYVTILDGKAYAYDTLANTIEETPFPENREEFEYFMQAKMESEIAKEYGSVQLAKTVVAYIHSLDRQLRQQFPGRQLTKQDYQSLFTKRSASAIDKYLMDFVSLMFMSANSEDWDKMLAFADTKFVASQGDERMLKNRHPRDRQMIGDNVYDLNDKHYGNNNLRAENAAYGSMLAGIIAGKRGASEIAGIVDRVNIIGLRVDAGEYDESYVKDVALAIRYAVDKGADIIQLGRSNTLYPYPHSQWVDDALRYAEQQGVLVVQPVMDLSYNLDYQPFYPNRHTRSGDLTNFITVAASDSLGNPYKNTNFSPAELDLFAPGADVKSAYVDGRYAEGSNSAFAAAMVTGTAALIKTYYPKITPAQMRQLLMDNVTGREDAEVEKQYSQYEGPQKGRLVADLFLFSDLCASGGILNAEKAFEAAKNVK